MAVTPINSEDRLVQATFAKHLEGVLGWDSIYAWNQETFGLGGTLGRADTKEAVLTRDLRAALERLNPDLPASAMDNALRQIDGLRCQPFDGAAQPGLLPPAPQAACACRVSGTPRAARSPPAPG